MSSFNQQELSEFYEIISNLITREQYDYAVTMDGSSIICKVLSEKAEDILIGEMDPQWLIDFTREKIKNIEENGITFDKIKELYTEFSKEDIDGHGYIPIECVYESKETVVVRWPEDNPVSEATFTLE